MELQGNTADRWEQVSTKLAELSKECKEKKKAINNAVALLKQSEKDLAMLQSNIEQLSNITYKEVLREESGTLNDEIPEFDNATDDTTESADGKINKSELSELDYNSDQPLIDESAQAELPLDNKE